VTSNDNINDPENSEPRDENSDSSPFGFSLDPEAISGMLNDMMGSSQLNFASGISGLGGGPESSPMGIAQRVAADIAAREIEDDALDEEQEAPASQQDPMAEIMNIMALLASPPTKTAAIVALRFIQQHNPTFLNKRAQMMFLLCLSSLPTESHGHTITSHQCRVPSKRRQRV
jgi:hypothetical protein